MNKTLIFIILGILVLGIVAGGIYYFYFSTSSSSEKINGLGGELPSGESAPSIQVEKAVKALADEKVLSPVLSADGKKILYFDKKTGRLFQVNLDGSGQEDISKVEAPNLTKVIWSKDKTKVIEVFDEIKILYDFVNQKTTPLNKNITEFSFGPKDNSFVYYLDGQIYLSNSDYKKVDPLYPIKMENLNLNWAGGKIYMTMPASEFAEGVLFSLDPVEKILMKVLTAPALLVNYSPDGSKILYSSRNNLFLEGAISISTLASKCVFSADSKNLYCAAPKSMPDQFVIDDYYQGLVEFNDEFWKINAINGEKTLIKSSADAPLGGVDAQNLIISPAEDYLIFINKKDGLLYSLKL